MAVRMDGAREAAVDVLDGSIAEELVADLVDGVRRSPERRGLLVELLAERHPVYAGRSANATIRLRGYVLAAFEEVGLPDAALVYAIEELESGRDAYLVAAAAKALRGLDTRERGIVPFLFRAVANIRNVDDALSFATYKPHWPLEGSTTALTEIIRTFAWLGGHGEPALGRLEAMEADESAFSPSSRAEIRRAIDAIRSGEREVEGGCCGVDGAVLSASGAPVRANGRPDLAVPTGVQFEDQLARSLSYGDFFTARPSVVAFFYTRCPNPNKCSLTVTKLARLQGAIRRAGLQGRLRTAGITYDPEFDLPRRLEAYGLNRGVAFTDDDRFLRATTGFDDLSAWFELGVSFGPVAVNRHRIELFVVDEGGRVAETFARLQWDVDEVLARAVALVRP